MREYTDRILRAVLRRAYDAPYYRERWGRTGVELRHLEDMTSGSLHRLPILAKEDLRRNPTAFVPEGASADHRSTAASSAFRSAMAGCAEQLREPITARH